MTTYLPVSAVVVFLWMNCWFIASLIRKRNDIVDVAWGLGFVLLAWLFLPVPEWGIRPWIVTMLVTVWGLRLAYHIWRRQRGKSEDPRYAAWRQTWRRFRLRSYLQIYLLQGALLWVIALPILVIHSSSVSPFGLLDTFGILVWLTGFAFESIADCQLQSFLTHHRGEIMQQGLWRYSRHPNYFGEVLQWWGIFLIALSVPHGLWTIVSPLTITVLILFVSGIPMLERRYAGRVDFEDYKKRTSVFFPLPPKQ